MHLAITAENKIMDETSLSLLNRLKNSQDEETWGRLVSLYAPLLKSWLRKYDVPSSDIDDLMQEVLLAVAKDLGAFDHEGNPGAFRSWLRAIVVNRLRNYWRTQGRRSLAKGGSDIERRLVELEDPASQLSQVWEKEHDRHVMRQLMALVEPQFERKSWLAFRRMAFDGAAAKIVASELGMSVNSVFIAKSRILRRLREEAEGLVESTSGFAAVR